MKDLYIHKQIIHCKEFSVEKYLTEVNKEALLTPEEEVELTRRIRKNDQQALEKLVRANLRFVVSVAKTYQLRGVSLLDLINEGNIGLIKAAQKFDETKGFRFISYAVWWIRQSIIQAIAEQGRTVRLPLNMVRKITQINKTFSEFELKYEREPSSEEIAKPLECTSKSVKQCWINSHKSISIDAPLDEEEENTMSDTMKSGDYPPDERLINESLNQDIEGILSSLLTEKEEKIIRLYFGLGVESNFSLKEVAKRSNLTTERVRQIKAKAIKKLKNNNESKRLKAYLG
ncbi:MAG: sigma-70 family RNA polymerase sigma factor [Bacteroidota bacterium]